MHPLFSRRGREFAVLLSGISLISFTILVLEISIMRLSSALFTYHYAFVAVSIAVLGMGLGGFLTHKLGSKISQRGVTRVLAEASVVFSLSISFVIMLVLSIHRINLYIYSSLMFVPFFLAGFMFAAVFKTFSLRSNLIYFFDLSGAAAGSLVAVSLFDRFGVVNTVFLLGAISSTGSVLFALSSKSKKTVLIAFFSLLLSSAIFAQSRGFGDGIQVRGDEKELHAVLDNVGLGARVILSKWGAYGRTDLVEFEKDPHLKVIFTDGGAGTKMYHFDGYFDSINTSVHQLKYSSAYFPFYFGERERVLVIGSGGGVDVLNALMGGAEQIFAVEVNPDTVEMVREHSDFNGGIYTKHDKVFVFIDEGRSFLRRSSLKYDVIVLNIPVTKTTQGVSGYSLAENYLFTTNSFTDYLDHLEPNGRVVIVAHDLAEAYKLTFTALKAFQERGIDVQEAMGHIVIVEELCSMHHTQTLPVFILKKSAFTEEEIREMYMKTGELAFNPVYFPGTTTLDPLLTKLSRKEISLADAISTLSIDVHPPSDDRPFFGTALFVHDFGFVVFLFGVLHSIIRCLTWIVFTAAHPGL